MTTATTIAPAAQSNQYAALGESAASPIAAEEQPQHVAANGTDAAYAPISSSVKAIHSVIVNNGLVQSALATVQSIVPTAVSERAVDAAQQAQAIGIQIAQPIVAKVDNKINSAIVGVQALPAYGAAKAQQADQLAFGLTPASLQPHYTAVKELAVSTVQRGVAVTGTTVERARAIKAERSEQLWNTLHALQAQVQTLRTTIEKSGAQATEALHLQERLAELQTKLNQAVDLAQEKRVQARHLSSEVLTTVTDLTQQLTSYLETSVLTPTQRETVHGLWARLVERVAGLKAQLYGTPSNPPSPTSSRSDSAAESTEEAAAAASAQQSDAKEGVVAGAAAGAADAAEAAFSSAAATATAAANNVKAAVTAAVEPSAETDSKTAAADSGAKKSKAAKKQHGKAAQHETEEKAKIAAE